MGPKPFILPSQHCQKHQRDAVKYQIDNSHISQLPTTAIYILQNNCNKAIKQAKECKILQSSTNKMRCTDNSKTKACSHTLPISCQMCSVMWGQTGDSMSAWFSMNWRTRSQCMPAGSSSRYLSRAACQRISSDTVN